MFDETDFMESTEWISRTAQEASDFLRERYRGDHERMTLVVGRFMARALLENKSDEVLFWGCVHSRVRRKPLGATTKRELETLLNEQRSLVH